MQFGTIWTDFFRRGGLMYNRQGVICRFRGIAANGESSRRNGSDVANCL
jgi:hypothetical protein